ncbi:MAG: radical SAM protein [Bacteroidales bacterium]
MNAYEGWLNQLINTHKEEYQAWSGLRWMNPYQAEEFQANRDLLLSRGGNAPLFRGTKPFHKQISRGCSLCGAGEWSCLFVTGRCNGRCFYCPTSQERDEVPSTQGMDFPEPADFAQYVKHFGFSGVSFSGGEPLLFFERTLAYLKEVRKVAGSGVYVWMYTNGILADKEKLAALASEGLDEIRFDIGATAYRLDRVEMARGIVPVVTIEIPAVPEEKKRILGFLPQMVRAGVSNLNLHQLRLTPHNVHALSRRNYTYVPAEKPLVLESELTALEILEAARTMDLDMGVNYCSFHFKHRFQKAGFRTRMAKAAMPSGGVLTSNGYLRYDEGSDLRYTAFRVGGKGAPVYPSDRVWEMPLSIPSALIETRVFDLRGLTPVQRREVDRMLEVEPSVPPSDPLLFRIWQLEYVEQGLREY